MENIGRTLGYGIFSKTFNDKFDSLPEDKKKILERVAHRLQTINKLSYETLFLSKPRASNFAFFRFELSSIQIYMYCTCIDTLAGNPKYQQFQDWLKTRDLSDLDSAKIDDYYNSYLNEHGDKKSFTRVFNNLSPNIKSWLNQNVAILPSNENEIPPNRDEEELIKKLTNYFYNSWRNPFTHQSITKPVNFFPNIDSFFPPEDGFPEKEWFQQPAHFSMNGKEWSLWHKKDIDLAVILRIIIQAIVFEWVGFEVTAELINKIIYRIHRLHWLYAYIHEIRANAQYLESWKEIGDKHSEEYLSEMQHFGVPKLSSSASIKIIEFFYANNNFEDWLREYIQEYIKWIDTINSLITKLNKKHPRTEKFEQKAETKKREKIKAFLLDLSTHTECEKVITHSRQSWRIWELIRDNSEYESKNISLPVDFSKKVN